METLLSGPGQQLTFCRGVLAVTGEVVEQASMRGLAAVPAAWVQQREKRDGQTHHMTFLSKVDLQQLSQQISEGRWNHDTSIDANDMTGIARAVAAALGKLSGSWDWIDVGTGTCKDANGEASFRVVLWPAAAALRQQLELPQKDFHITLGFQDSDIHNKCKGVASLKSPDATCLPNMVQLASRLMSSSVDLMVYGPSIQELLQIALQELSAHDEAVDSLVKCLEALCLYHGRQKQPEDVLVFADQLLQLRKSDVGYRSRGFALMMLQQYQEALDTLEHAENLATTPLEEREAQRMAQAMAMCRKKLGIKAADGYADGSADSLPVAAKGNYPKTPHLPFSPGVNPDDTRISDCKHLLQAEVVVTEKLDGGNCCLKDGQVYGRTHAQPASHESFSAVKELAANLGNLLQDVQVFGENMQAVHSIEYGNLQSFFYVFAARRGHAWLSWDETVALAESLGLPMVPLVFRGTFSSPEQLQKSLEKWKAEKSAVGADVEAEGFVVRRSAAIQCDAFADEVAKFVRANHIQTDEAWKRKWKKAGLGMELEPLPLRKLELD